MFFSRSVPCETVGKVLWLSASVSPCPGKCLAQAKTPAFCKPRINAKLCFQNAKQNPIIVQKINQLKFLLQLEPSNSIPDQFCLFSFSSVFIFSVSHFYQEKKTVSHTRITLLLQILSRSRQSMPHWSEKRWRFSVNATFIILYSPMTRNSGYVRGGAVWATRIPKQRRSCYC